MRLTEKLYMVEAQGYSSNTYIVVGEKAFAIIDPGLPEHVEKVLSALENWGIREGECYIICTHMHYDHIGGAKLVKERLDGKLLIHENEKEYLENGDTYATVALFFGVSRLEPIKCDTALKDGDIIDLGGVTLRIIHTPGHTIGSISIYVPEIYALITGDTIFENGAYGRTDLPTGDISLLINSLKKLKDIQASILCPGHGMAYKGDVRKVVEQALQYITE
ncbi:MAG: MBL fold metallo-hydrolase [Candidatus Njordarchaeales archaeon]